MTKIEFFDPKKFPPNRRASRGSQGICTYGTTCGDKDAEYMEQVQGRTGLAWRALCRDHALKRVHMDERLLPSPTPTRTPA